MSSFKEIKLFAVFVVVVSSLSSSSPAQIPCPPMPDKITQVNHDVQSDVQLGIGSLGKLQAGQLGVKTDVIAKNLFDKYPNADRVIVVQMMAATYCPMIRDDKTLKDGEKRQLWSEFQDRVFKFANPSYSPSPAQRPKSKPNVSHDAGQQSSSTSSQPKDSAGPNAGTEKTNQADNCKVRDQYETGSIYRNGATPDLSGCRQVMTNSVVEGEKNRPPLTLTVSGQDTTLTQNTITDTNIDITKDAKNTQLNKNLTGYGDTVLGKQQNGTGADMGQVYTAQTANVFKCPAPCGPHGPYPDVALEGMPSDLPNARALSGSSRALAGQLSGFIDEGNALVSRFLRDDNADALAAQATAWELRVEQVVSSMLDPQLAKALSQVNSKQLSAMTNHNQKGIDLCNSLKAKTDLLTMFYNQLLGVGD